MKRTEEECGYSQTWDSPETMTKTERVVEEVALGFDDDSMSILLIRNFQINNSNDDQNLKISSRGASSARPRGGSRCIPPTPWDLSVPRPPLKLKRRKFRGDTWLLRIEKRRAASSLLLPQVQSRSSLATSRRPSTRRRRGAAMLLLLLPRRAACREAGRTTRRRAHRSRSWSGSAQQQSPPRRRGNKKQATEPTATEVRPWEPAKKKKKREARLHL